LDKFCRKSRRKGLQAIIRREIASPTYGVWKGIIVQANWEKKDYAMQTRLHEER
jgi:hypothetical protein